jgi:hypothetical protein
VEKLGIARGDSAEKSGANMGVPPVARESEGLSPLRVDPFSVSAYPVFGATE